MCIINQSDLLFPIAMRNFKVTLKDIISVRHMKCSVNLSMLQNRISEYFKRGWFNYHHFPVQLHHPVKVGPAVQSADIVLLQLNQPPQLQLQQNNFFIIKIHLNISMVASIFLTFCIRCLFFYLFISALWNIYPLPSNLTVVSIKVIKVIKLMRILPCQIMHAALPTLAFMFVNVMFVLWDL